MNTKISIIGSGNVATFLATSFFNCGCSIIEICSRNISNAQNLANLTNASVCNSVNDLKTNVDFIIIAANDANILNVTMQIAPTNAIIVHCSGAVSIDVLSNNAKNYGVIYPLQTLSKNQKPLHKNFPFFIEGNTDSVNTNIKILLQNISNNIHNASSQQRKMLHLSAVFTNNFVNHILGISKLILENENLNFNLLQPLLLETIDKTQTYHPFQIQTGPAIRNDEKTLDLHRKLLENHNQNFTTIYNAISKSIQENIKQ